MTHRGLPASVLTLFAGRRHIAKSPKRELGFWAGLIVASIAHAALFVSFDEANQSRLGQPNSNPEGMAVDVIDEAELDSRSSAQASAASMPAQPQATPPSAEVPPSEPPRPPEPPQPAETASAPPEPKSIEPPPNIKESFDLFPAPSQAAPKPDHKLQQKAAKAPSRSMASLDLSMPSASQMPVAAMGGSASFQRPAGITRSGENDDFGREVINALRRTMPPHKGIFSRVTIRFVLNESGNITKIEILAKSIDAGLDQDVLFAAQQSSFPLPPAKSTLLDRIFVVTYIYN